MFIPFAENRKVPALRTRWLRPEKKSLHSEYFEGNTPETAQSREFPCVMFGPKREGLEKDEQSIFGREADVAICAVCGNECENGGVVCRFCGTKQEPLSGKNEGILHKTVNLEKGRPVVATAIKRLTAELQTAKIENVKVLIVIHGWGSSGKGGAIKDECRRYLDFLSASGEIKQYIPGEDLSGRSGSVKALRRRFPGLAANRILDRSNPGLTLVIMR